MSGHFMKHSKGFVKMFLNFTFKIGPQILRKIVRLAPP